MQNKTLRSLIALLTATCGVVTIATAGFRVVGEAPQVSFGLRSIDHPVVTAQERAQGVVNGLPMLQGLQLLARGWTVLDTRTKKVEGQLISWQAEGSKSWDQLANDLLTKSGIYAEATWATKTLVLRDPVATVEPKIAITPKAEAVPIAAPPVPVTAKSPTAASPSPMATIAPSAVTQSGEAARAVKSIAFDAAGGEPLSGALKRFAVSQQWSIEWEVPSDYIVKREYSIAGDKFEEVLQRVLADYRLSATLYSSNRVLAIRESVRKD